MSERARLQDIVAKTSGVGLTSVVRVLLALGMVTETWGETELSNSLHFLLRESARRGPEPDRLASLPSTQDMNACEDDFDELWKRYGKEALKNVKTLKEDPYFVEAKRGQ